jgi:predicted Holliday junction resolvase-like endonuclease
MENTILYMVVSLVVIVVLFFLFREVANWYWKINERIALQYKTNFLLERISMQLGSFDLDEIIVEEIATGKRKKLKMDKWIEHKMKNPDETKYRTVKSETDNIKKKNETPLETTQP